MKYKNRRKAKPLIKEMVELANLFLSFPNQCAYTDRIIEEELELIKQLKATQE